MLTAFEVENFKGIGRRARIEFRPVTMLFGPNSAGKSTVLHALHYAHEILSRRNLDPDRTYHGGDAVDLGGFRTFVHKKHSADTERAVHLRFELDLRGQELPELPPPRPEQTAINPAEGPEPLDFYNERLSEQINSGWLELLVEWSVSRNAPILRSYEIGVNGEKFACLEASPDGAQVDFVPRLQHPLFAYDGRLSEGDIGDEMFQHHEDWRANEEAAMANYRGQTRIGVRGLGRSSLPTWGALLDLAFEIENNESFAYPRDEFRYRSSAVLVGMGQLVRDELARFRYLGPMRDVLPRMYSPPRLPEPGRWASGLAAWDLLYARGEEFTRGVSSWLSSVDRLDTGYGLGFRSFKELREDSPLMLAIRRGTVLDDIDDLAAEVASLPTRPELRLVDARTGLDVHPSDVGVGISQVIPVVVAALDASRPGITAIEQPELHIHPRIQVELGDLFAQQASGDHIFLLETHSEHLMLRLLRRIEQTHSGELPAGKPELRPDQVSVVFVERTDNEVRISQLRIDETGEFIDRWPHGFFEERVPELF